MLDKDNLTANDGLVLRSRRRKRKINDQTHDHAINGTNSQKGKTSSDCVYIPQEVLISILLNLPSKSLIRFRYVCKSWNSLIVSPFFKNIHLNQSILLSRTNPLFLVIGQITSPWDVISKHVSIHFDNESLDKHLEIELPCKNMKEDFFVVIGYCNGILCIRDLQTDSGHSLFLWNPSINKCLKLEARTLLLLDAVGFGYDSQGSDYKVVRCSASSQQVEAEVYSLNARSWKSINVSIKSFIRFFSCRCRAFVNGVVHWLVTGYVNGSVNKKRQAFVIGFSLSHESFKEIMLPECLSSNLQISMSNMSVFEESLAVSVVVTEENGSTCSDLWVLKEYDRTESWTKQLRIRPWIEKAIVFRKNGELLIHIFRDNWLVSYNPESKVIQYLESLKRCDYLYVSCYIESLVLLDESNDKFEETKEYIKS